MSGWAALNSSIICWSNFAGPWVWPCQNSISTGLPPPALELPPLSSPPPQATTRTAAARAAIAASILINLDMSLSSSWFDPPWGWLGSMQSSRAHRRPSAAPERLGEAIAMGRCELVAHFPDRRGRETRRSVGVKHHSLLDVLRTAFESGPDRELGYVQVGAVERSQLGRERADVNRLQAAAVDEARNLDARIGGKVVDQAGVADVPVDHAGASGLARVDDPRPVRVA